jgi:hypothetical protein
MIILSRKPWLDLPRARPHTIPASAISRTLSGLPQRARDLTILLDADPEIPVLCRQAGVVSSCYAGNRLSELVGLTKPSTVQLSGQVAVGRTNLTPGRIRPWS